MCAPEAGADLESPPNVLPAAASWAAVHTQPRAEKRCAGILAERRVVHFLPMTLSRKVYGHQVRKTWLPLFPGYLFLEDTPEARRHLFATKKVARVLTPKDPAGLARDLEGIARALAADPEARAAQDLEPGVRVEVVHGPLRGLFGELIRHKGGARLVIRVEFIGYGAVIDIDEAFVMPARERGVPVSTG
jgi:transcriptional antiterminator RfaH